MDNEKEHDFTKLMLETIRAKSSNHIKTLNEDEGGGAGGFGGGFDSGAGGATTAPTSGDDIESNLDDTEGEVDTTDANEEGIENSEESGLDSPEAKEEITKIREMVNNLVKVNTFKIHEDTGNVVMSGELQNADLEWQYSKDDGFFINATNVNLTDELKAILDKLTAYYTNWRDDWAGKIDEYTAND